MDDGQEDSDQPTYQADVGQVRPRQGRLPRLRGNQGVAPQTEGRERAREVGGGGGAWDLGARVTQAAGGEQTGEKLIQGRGSG